MHPTLACLILLSLGLQLRADVIPASLFTDNAVLQRDKPIPVWGTADRGEQVSVTFAGKTVSTITDSQGKWQVVLPILPAIATPGDVVIKGKNTVTLTNVVVGEVWLASGQSNMEWPVKKSTGSDAAIKASANYPLIRHIAIGKNVSDTPLASIEGAWKVAGLETTGDFTGVGYYFALSVYQRLNVPVGIIKSSWGGSRIEAWMDPTVIKSTPAFSSITKEWSEALAKLPEANEKYKAELDAWRKEQADAKAAQQPFTKRAPGKPRGSPGDYNTPGGIFNAMIAPLVPYALRGTIWYQGESNVDNASSYHAFFTSLITTWRAQFKQGDFPFYWVQLANFNSNDANGTGWASLREAQTRTLAIPKTGQAIIIDIGNPTNVHPYNKIDVGLRLARIALARTYGQKIVDSGPTFTKATREGAGYRVSFTHTDGGLRAPKPPLSGFELAGEDKVFQPADAKIEKDSVVVSSAAIPKPVAVRYAWRNAPAAGLFNGENLPAVPFRSDTW